MIGKLVACKRSHPFRGNKGTYRPTPGVNTWKTANQLAFSPIRCDAKSKSDKQPQPRRVGYTVSSRELMPVPVHNRASMRTKFYPRNAGFTKVASHIYFWLCFSHTSTCWQGFNGYLFQKSSTETGLYVDKGAGHRPAGWDIAPPLVRPTLPANKAYQLPPLVLAAPPAVARKR